MSQENEGITSIDQLAAALAAEDTEQDVENAQPESEAQSDDQQEQPELEENQEQPVEGEGDQPATESLDDKVVSWETASGDKFEVPVAELKAGYMREQDYRHKTQNFALERDQAAQQVQQQYQAAQAYARELGAMHVTNAQIAALEQAIPTMDKDSDPISYFDAVTQLQQLRENRNALGTHLQQAEQQRQAEMQAAHAQAQQRMAAELQTTLPGFGKEMLGKLDAAGQSYGFTTQELGMVTDPRVVRMLHDAMQYQALKAKAPATVNKVKTAPIKPAKQASTAVQTGVEQQIKQFSKNKSLGNFAALLAKTM